jgi:hypothetical protein
VLPESASKETDQPQIVPGATQERIGFIATTPAS